MYDLETVSFAFINDNVGGLLFFLFMLKFMNNCQLSFDFHRDICKYSVNF